jgi:hypothetical protein
VLGVPLAGKSEIVSRFATAHALRITSNVTRDDVPSLVRTVVGAGVAVSTIPGAYWDVSHWQPLLAAAHRLLVVIDPHRSWEAASRALFEFTSPWLANLPREIQVTKLDLINRADYGSNCFSPAEAVERYGFEAGGIFESSIYRPETVLLGLNALVTAP